MKEFPKFDVIDKVPIVMIKFLETFASKSNLLRSDSLVNSRFDFVTLNSLI